MTSRSLHTFAAILVHFPSFHSPHFPARDTLWTPSPSAPSVFSPSPRSRLSRGKGRSLFEWLRATGWRHNSGQSESRQSVQFHSTNSFTKRGTQTKTMPKIMPPPIGASGSGGTLWREAVVISGLHFAKDRLTRQNAEPTLNDARSCDSPDSQFRSACI
jgi:hypothetical protein